MLDSKQRLETSSCCQNVYALVQHALCQHSFSCAISCQQLPLCREAISALCLIVAAPAEAMIHPMFPLLQSLVCHTWCAYQRNQGQQIVQPAAGRQSKAEGSTHHLQSAQFVVLEQQQQPSEWQQLPAGQQAEQGVAVPQLTPCISLHTLDLRDSVAEDTSELKTQQRQSEQDTKPQLSRHARSSLKGFSPEHRLKVSSMRAAALEQLLDQTLLTEQSTMRLPWCFTSAASANAQATHLKLLLCVVVLAALPFVAWLKQPRHMREWTCTQDALPAAVVAMHAPMLCLLVSVSDPCAFCVITVPSPQVFLCLLIRICSDRIGDEALAEHLLDLKVHSEKRERQQSTRSCWYSLRKSNKLSMVLLVCRWFIHTAQADGAVHAG